MKLEGLQSGIRYRAILRDMDGRLLATGKVRIDTSAARGWFWPQKIARPDSPLIQEAKIEIPHFGLVVTAYNLKVCDPPTHLDFDLTR